MMDRSDPSQESTSRRTTSLEAVWLCMASVLMLSAALWGNLISQKIAQRPGQQGVLTFHLSKRGDLRLWNQTILPQEIPLILQRLEARSSQARMPVVRLIPDSEVPWGVVQGILSRLQPDRKDRRWILQLQLP